MKKCGSGAITAYGLEKKNDSAPNGRTFNCHAPYACIAADGTARYVLKLTMGIVAPGGD